MSNLAPHAANPTEPGTILAGKYRVERVIGRGGMGVVVEARHITLEERVALKFLLPECAVHPEAGTRFMREARAAVKIKSEHVARVSDVGTLESGVPYMVMEYLDGRDLRRVIEIDGVLALADAVDYVIQGCEAIAEAHGHGIVHRDLKPANLFLTARSNGSPLVKVLDFGISKMTGQGVDSLTKTTATMGSALYMSPEQMQAVRGVDHRTDIYALGVSLYEILAGKQPFYGETLPQLCAEVFTGTPTPIRSLRRDLPEAFAAVLEKAYARDRGQRYQSIAEMVVALAPFAPPRTHPTIEGIARMGGLEAPPTHVPAHPVAPSHAHAGAATSAPATRVMAHAPPAALRDTPDLSAQSAPITRVAGGAGPMLASANLPEAPESIATVALAKSAPSSIPTLESATPPPVAPAPSSIPTLASATPSPVASAPFSIPTLASASPSPLTSAGPPVVQSRIDPSTQRSTGVPAQAAVPPHSLVSVVSAPPAPSSRAPLVALGIAVMVATGTAAFFALRPAAVKPVAAAQAETSAPAPPPVTATTAPAAASAAPPAASAAPAPATAVPEPSVAAAPVKPLPTAKRAPAPAKPRAPPAPQKPDVGF